MSIEEKIEKLMKLTKELFVLMMDLGVINEGMLDITLYETKVKLNEYKNMFEIKKLGVDKE